MSDQGLLEAFNDCLDRINAGQNINDCLRAYPQYAAALRPMLEVGKLVERAQVSPFEVESAQSRVRARMNERLQQSTRRSRPPYARFALLAASFLITFVAALGMAEGSLPGDTLYGLKRFSEGARSVITGEQFEPRRLDEIRVLLALRRIEEVTFSGTIDRIDADRWQVAALPVRVASGTTGSETLAVGDRVAVEAETSPNGELFARAFTLLDQAELTPTPAFTQTLVLSPTAEATQTVTPPATNTPAPTTTTPPTLAPTSTPSPTPTHTTTQVATTLAPTIAVTLTPTVCAPAQPLNWVSYRIQPNDTVAGLANMTGVSVDQLVLVNCLPPNLMIIVGQYLFLPSMPPAQQQPTLAAPPPQGDQGGSSNSGSGSSDDDDDDDDSGQGGGDDDDDD
jgi:LysM repeat protein